MRVIRRWVSPQFLEVLFPSQCVARRLLLRYVLRVDDSEDTASTLNSTLVGNTNPRFL